MSIEALRALVVAAMTWLGHTDHLPAPSDAIPDAIALAVHSDTEGRITGTEAGDAVYLAVEAFYESRFGWTWSGRELVFDECREGDGGKSFGMWQLQVRREIGCAVVDAARYWLHFAHGSQRRCAGLPLDERLAELHSGTCARGHVLSRFRYGQAVRLLDRLMPAE
jgi:hypothetical protein